MRGQLNSETHLLVRKKSKNQDYKSQQEAKALIPTMPQQQQWRRIKNIYIVQRDMETSNKKNKGLYVYIE